MGKEKENKKKWFVEMFKPNFPKIFLYALLSFILPTFVKICSDAGCVWKLKLLVGYYALIRAPNVVGQLNFGMMWLLFLEAYIMASVVVFILHLLKKRKYKI